MKRIIALLITAVMVLSLVACGSSSSSDSSQEAAPAQEAEKEEPAAEPAAPAAEEPAEETAEADETYDAAFIIQRTTSSYCSAYYEVFQEYNKTYPDINWSFYDSQVDATLQSQQVEDAIAKGVDLIMIFPLDATALTSAVKKAKDAGILVLIVNCQLDENGMEYVDAFIGPNDYLEGSTAADAAHELFPDGGNFVVLGCDSSYQNARDRENGFIDRANEMGYNFTQLGETAITDWKLELGLSNTTAFLAKYPGEIDMVFAVDDPVGLGALQAVQEDVSGLNDDIKIFSINGIEAVFDEIKKGENYYCSIYQSPSVECPDAIDMAHEMLIGNMPAEKINSIDTPAITPANVNDYEPAY